MLDKIRGGIYGLAAGDALGVPVEFMDRRDIAANPVTDMRGWGTYMQPPGTWSDDTGMVLATMDSLANGFDPDDIMAKFVTWSHGDDYWPYDQVFDMGTTTNKAISRFKSGVPALACGMSSERDNGNGSLMRILPMAFYLYPQEGIAVCRNKEAMHMIHDLSKITHAHPRSFIACGFYVSIACQLMAGRDVYNAVQEGIVEAARYYLEQSYVNQMEHYVRLAGVSSFAGLPMEEIRSSGYVVHTLEAALWCLLNTDNYADCVLLAANMGEDTDTVAAVAGGLAGLAYGIDSIPAKWRLMMPKTGRMDEVCKGVYEAAFLKKG